MKTADVQRRGLGLIRGVLANLAAFLDIRGMAAPGAAVQAATSSDGNTAGYAGVPAAAAPSAAETGVAAFLAGLAEDVKDAFDSKVDPRTGAPWPPRRDALPHPLLVRTGRLRAAAIEAVQQARLVGGGVEVDLTDPAYGFYHQFGTQNMPARPYFGASPATVERAAGDVILVVENMLAMWGR